MLLINRLLFAASACLLLSNCGLIGTALRLAPYALLLADEEGKPGSGKMQELRARQVEERGVHGLRHQTGSQDSGLAFRR